MISAVQVVDGSSNLWEKQIPRVFQRFWLLRIAFARDDFRACRTWTV